MILAVIDPGGPGAHVIVLSGKGFSLITPTSNPRSGSGGSPKPWPSTGLKPNMDKAYAAEAAELPQKAA